MLRLFILTICSLLLLSCTTAWQYVDWPGVGNSTDPANFALGRVAGRSFLSNSERLRRGLPPNRPKRLYDPSKTGAHLAKRSGAPVPVLNIAAAYASAPNTVIGYLAIDSSNPTGWYGLCDLVPLQPLGDIFTNIPNSAYQSYIQTTACPSYTGAQQWTYGLANYAGGNLGTGNGAAMMEGGGSLVQPMWNWSNLPGPITLQYTNTDGTVGFPKAYADRTNGMLLLFGASAADVVAQFGLGQAGGAVTVTEADQVILSWKYTIPIST